MLSLMSQSPTAEKWMVLELFLVPTGVILSSNVLVGTRARSSIEPLLARSTARALFATRAAVRFGVLVLIAALFGLFVHPLGLLVAMARLTLGLGVLHTTLNIARTISLGIIVYAVWWLTGVTYMTAWAESVGPVGLVLHPMRLGGGAELSLWLEVSTLCLGLVFLGLAWLLVGRDARWLNAD